MSAWNIDTDAHSLIAIGPHIPLMRESNRQDLRKSACGLLRIGDTMRNMPGCHVMTGRFTVALLVIKKDVCVESLEKLTFGQTSKKKRLVDPDVPGA